MCCHDQLSARTSFFLQMEAWLFINYNGDYWQFCLPAKYFHGFLVKSYNFLKLGTLILFLIFLLSMAGE